MSRFNLKFKRSGRFYMEGEVTVELDSNGEPLPLTDVIAKAHEGDWVAYRPTQIEYFDDETHFYPGPKEKAVSVQGGGNDPDAA
jgi:hypothetical protein